MLLQQKGVFSLLNTFRRRLIIKEQIMNAKMTMMAHITYYCTFSLISLEREREKEILSLSLHSSSK